MAALLLLLSLAWAGPLSDGYAAFEAGDLDAAIEAWQPAVDGGSPSGAVLYDLGNAWYRKGDLPRAIAHYRAAQRLNPSKGDVHHNLALARSGLEGVPRPVGPVPGWVAIVTPGLLALLGLATTTAGTVTAFAWWRRRDRGLLVGAVGALVVGLVLSAVAWSGGAAEVAVVVDHPAAVRDMPLSHVDPMHRLAPGAEVRVLDRSGDFLLVEDGEGRRGWVPDRSVLRPGRS